MLDWFVMGRITIQSNHRNFVLMPLSHAITKGGFSTLEDILSHFAKVKASKHVIC